MESLYRTASDNSSELKGGGLTSSMQRGRSLKGDLLEIIYALWKQSISSRIIRAGKQLKDRSEWETDQFGTQQTENLDSATWTQTQNVAHTAVLRPLVEMTTIHYKPFENSHHKCHPLSAVSTPRTQGIFKKPNLQLSEILLNSYLFAAGSFCAIPLLCIGAEINHRAVHAAISMISDCGCREGETGFTTAATTASTIK